MTKTERHEIKFTFQTGAGREIIQTFQNPNSDSDTIIAQIPNLNSYLATNNDFWYEDPRELIGGIYTDDNKIIKVVKADIFDQTKVIEDNKTTLLEVTETIYQEI